MASTRDSLNAFLDYPEAPPPATGDGPLAGLSLGVKDIYDVAGYPTGGGSPERARREGIAGTTAPAVQRLFDAGAQFAGKTQSDELTFSMIGMNAHYPAPVNSRAPQRVTGGSSSGSAAAVAGGLVDIAVGSDTNGSIRAPASFCGLIGLRTTHGRIPLEGAMALSPAFDTFGWFAADPAVYEKVGEVLLGEDTHRQALVRPMRIAALEGQLFGDAERSAYGTMLRDLAGRFARDPAFLALPGEVEELFTCFKEIQAFEAWREHGSFIEKAGTKLGPGVKERFAYARTIDAETVEKARARRRLFQDAFSALFDDDMVVVMPSQPSAAPLKNSTQDELETYRAAALALTSIAGLLGWPQITVPLGRVHQAPFGISLLGPPGSDRQLIRMATDALSKT